MPKKPCNCPSCSGTLRHPKTIKKHSDIQKQEARRSTDEKSSGDNGEGSAELEEDAQRSQKQCRTDTQSRLGIKQEDNILGNAEIDNKPSMREFQDSVSKNRDQPEDESDEEKDASIDEIKNETLGNASNAASGNLDPAATERLEQKIADLSAGDPDLRLSLDLYMSCINEPDSRAIYNNLRKTIIRHFPEPMEILSYHRAKKIIVDSSVEESPLNINRCLVVRLRA